MKRIALTALAAFCLAGMPVLAGADEMKTEHKSDKDGTSSKVKMEKTKADGTKVEHKAKSEAKTDGSGETASETKVTAPDGTESKSKKRVTKKKNDDGSTSTKTESKTETSK